MYASLTLMYSLNNRVFNIGPNVCKVLLRTPEILSSLLASAGTLNPVILENCCANSVIIKISINGLCRDASYISILGMEFTSQMSCGFWQMLTQVKSIKCFIQNPTENEAQFIRAVHCTWNPTTRHLTASIIDLLSHVKIFYWKSPCIELYMELCYENAAPSTTCISDVPHPAFGIKPPQSCMIMATTLHDNDQIMYNLPNVAVMVDESLEMDAAQDDRANSTTETTEVACEDGSFQIRLGSTQLYSIIKAGSVGIPYPEAFRTNLTINGHKFSVLLKVFPFKSMSKHISVWAEITAPSHARGQVTLHATAFDPQKEQRLGHTIECTGQLKRSDSGDHKRVTLTLEEVMLHMFTFYKSPDVELRINITIS